MGTTGTPITISGSLDYLLPRLRAQLGDTDSTAYRYLDEWLRVGLVSAVKAMQRWWADRYTVDESTNEVTRDTVFTFLEAEPPIIQHRDERPIILMASILIKSGQLENNSWGVGSWKDAEIAVSNIEGNKAKTFSYGMDWTELQMYILPPTKKLFVPVRQSLPDEEDYQG